MFRSSPCVHELPVDSLLDTLEEGVREQLVGEARGRAGLERHLVEPRRFLIRQRVGCTVAGAIQDKQDGARRRQREPTAVR